MRRRRYHAMPKRPLCDGCDRQRRCTEVDGRRLCDECRGLIPRPSVAPAWAPLLLSGRKPEGMEDLTVDLVALADWLQEARGFVITVEAPLEEHQRKLLDTIGVIVKVEPPA